MIQQVMPKFREKKNVIVLCDSWSVKHVLIAIVDKYKNLDLNSNAKSDSVIYNPTPEKTGKRGRPPEHGRRLSIKECFVLSNKKVVTITSEAVACWPTSLEQDRSRCMSHPPARKMAQENCFSVLFSPPNYTSSVPGRINPL